MKTLLESIQESFVNEAVKFKTSMFSGDFVDFYNSYVSGNEDDYKENLDYLDIKGAEKTNFEKLFDILKGLDANVNRQSTGNIYWEEEYSSLSEWLINGGFIDNKDHGFILNCDGDDDMCVIVTYQKNPSSNDQKLIDQFLHDMYATHNMHIADSF